MYPLGYVTHVLPSGKDLLSSQRVINLLHQVRTRHSVDAVQVAKAIDVKASIEHSSDTKVEILHDSVVAIGHHSREDIDLVLSIRARPIGGFSVGVHVADIGRFVTKDDILDRIAARRVISYHSATNKVFRMLPENFSKKFGSSHVDKDGFALSVYIETDHQHNVIDSADPTIGKSIIRNCKSLSYVEVQQLIDGDPVSSDITRYQSDVMNMHIIAQHMRMNRIREGRFFVNELEDPFATVDELVHQQARQLVEELTIAANVAVTQLLLKKFPETIPVLRQIAPTEEIMEDWLHQQTNIKKLSFFFKQFELLRNRFSGDANITHDANSSIAILNSTAKALKNGSGNLVAVIGAELRHPLHALAVTTWHAIQVGLFSNL